MIKKKFKITDMHCTSCSMLIDGELEDLEGVKSASTNFAKGETEVEFDDSKLNNSSLVETIKKAGYTAIPQE